MAKKSMHTSRREGPRKVLTARDYISVPHTKTRRNFQSELSLALATSEVIHAKDNRLTNSDAIKFLMKKGIRKGYALIMSAKFGTGLQSEYDKIVKNYVELNSVNNCSEIQSALMAVDCQKVNQGKYLNRFRKRWEGVYENVCSLVDKL